MRTQAVVCAGAILFCACGVLHAQDGMSLETITSAAAEAEGRLSKRDLKRVEGGGRAGTFYDFVSVRDLLTSARQILEKPLLDHPQLIPLRDYVQRFYPNPQSLALPPIEPAGRGAGRGGAGAPEADRYVTDEAAGSAIARALGVVSGIHGMSSLAVDLSVHTKPAEKAVVTLQARDGTRHSGTSNTKFTGVYRGLYIYTVSKDGMKTITDDVNLVIDSRPLLDCTLAPVNTAGGPYPCNRK